jgi:hypothetical protein
MEPDVQGKGPPRSGSRAPSFTRAMVTTFSIYASSFIVVLVPLLGAILSFTLVPYFASAFGTRWAHPKERVPVSLTASIVWSVFETAVIMTVVSSIPTPTGFVLDDIGLAILGLIWACNIGFGILGALHPWMDPFKDYSKY